MASWCVHAEPADSRWTATPSVSWIRVVYNTASGTGDRTIYISVDQTNTAPAPRAEDVVVAGLSESRGHLRVGS